MSSNFSMPLSARHLFRCLVVKANFTRYTSRFLLPLPAPRGLPSQSLTPAIYSSRNLRYHPPPLSFPHTPCAICQHVWRALFSKLIPRHSTLLLATSTTITLIERHFINKSHLFIFAFVVFDFGVKSTIVAKTNVKEFALCFFRNIMVSSLMFKSSIYFE